MEVRKIILLTLSPNTHRTSEENLGIAYLKGALLKKGYDVEIIDAWLNELSVDEVYDKIISNNNLLFVGISSYMSNTKPSLELISKIKKYDKGIKIVCGGFGPTFNPREYLESGADYIIRGEGEKTICELADAIKNEEKTDNIKNLGFLKENNLILNEMHCLNEDLDSIPFPARDTIDTVLSKKSTVNMVTSRGCFGNCDFCSVASFFNLSEGKRWRTRSIDNIVDEIEQLSNYGVKYIKMVDDSFVDGNRDEEWCKIFADKIIERGIDVRMRGQIRADKINDDILKNLKRAGFFSFACGIENGSQSSLNRMHKTATVSDNEKALELLKKYGYIIQMGFILFDNSTTMEELEENYRFLEKHSYAVTKGIFSEMFSAEGTRFNEKLKQSNKLLKGKNVLNNKYNIEEEKVRTVYNALKKWHKSHSIVYDMTIDPITAPKAIPMEEISKFYDLAMDLKEKDLLFFKQILDSAKRLDDNAIDEIVNLEINNTQSDYAYIAQKVKKLYKNNQIEYNAMSNPFI